MHALAATLRHNADSINSKMVNLDASRANLLAKALWDSNDRGRMDSRNCAAACPVHDGAFDPEAQCRDRRLVHLRRPRPLSLWGEGGPTGAGRGGRRDDHDQSRRSSDKMPDHEAATRRAA